MVRGVIFDLGSTLIFNESEHQWQKIRPRMIADLIEDLRAQGALPRRFEASAFETAFARNVADFDAQRQHHFKEITAEYTLRVTLNQLGLNPNGLDFDRALKAYFTYSESLWQEMPHVHDVLGELRRRGLRLAIVSNASDDANVQRLIDNHRLRPYFDPIVVSAAQGVRKPNPRIFDPVLKAWQLAPAEIVMIGDTLGADVLGAKNAGMKSVWARMEADTPGNAAHRRTIIPDAAVESLAEIPEILERIQNTEYRSEESGDTVSF